LGVAIGVLVTLVVLVGYYVIHKRNKTKKAVSSRDLHSNIVFVGHSKEYMSQNPLVGRNESMRSFSDRTMFAPVGVRSSV